MYQENDFVIHRSNGLCRVIGTGYPEFGGVKSSSICYILENQRNKGRLYTPVENGETILRPVMNIEQAEELVGHLRSIEVIAEDNEKLREQAYRKALHEEGYVGWAKIIKTAYEKRTARMKAGKKSTVVDRKYEKQAQDYLYDELALVYRIPREQVEDYLVQRVESELA